MGPWLAECRVGDWLVVDEQDTYAVAYPNQCRGNEAKRICLLLAAAPDMLRALQSSDPALAEAAIRKATNGKG